MFINGWIGVLYDNWKSRIKEEAQFFYRKIGYVDNGALLLLPNEPLEIILYKKL